MKNLTKGEMTFRVTIGILLVLAFYNPGTVHDWIIWISAVVLIISGMIMYCPVCQVIDK